MRVVLSMTTKIDGLHPDVIGFVLYCALRYIDEDPLVGLVSYGEKLSLMCAQYQQLPQVVLCVSQ